jgi:radical SAM-linked protein
MIQRIRIYYEKRDFLRYTSHLNLHLIWERTMRRARLPLAYSQGYHPQPRLNQALPLPLGITSTAEVLDCWLDPDCTLLQIQALLVPVLHPGLYINNIIEVDIRGPALQTLVERVEYQTILLDPIDTTTLKGKVGLLLEAPTLPRMRRGKAYDLRPLIHIVKCSAPDTDGHNILYMNLNAHEGATGRPDEVLSALDYDPCKARIVRVGIQFMAVV